MSLRFSDSNKLWLSSDFHFGHANIIKHSRRIQFTTPEETDTILHGSKEEVKTLKICQESVDRHDQCLIDNINALVKEDDTLFFLGDFAYRNAKPIEYYRNQLNVKSIVFIRGNHDKFQDGQVKCFNSIHDYLKIRVKDDDAAQGWQPIVLCHYAFRTWDGSHHGSWNCYGHSHGSLPDDPNALAFDVGVDCHNFCPISYQQVKEIMSKKTFKPIDHHGN